MNKLYKLQSFAGTALEKQDYRVLREKVFRAVLVEMVKPQRKGFVTPEEYVSRYKARFGQVNHILSELVEKKVLKEPVTKSLDSGRTQKYFYFNKSPQQTITFVEEITKNTKM